MRLAGIYSLRHHAYKTTTNSNHKYLLAPNLLKRNLFFNRPNQAWVGDIIYIPTGEGLLYLAIAKNHGDHAFSMLLLIEKNCNPMAFSKVYPAKEIHMITLLLKFSLDV